jgi:putative flippase GtrA
MKSEGLVQFIKFGIVGITNTAVDWVVFFVITHYIATEKSFEPTAKAIAFLIAVTNSYLWNTIWTFKKEYKTAVGNNTGASGKLFIKFLVVSLIGWGINYLAFKYTRFNLDQGQIVALIAASGAATLWNFFGNKLWTYKK